VKTIIKIKGFFNAASNRTDKVSHQSSAGFAEAEGVRDSSDYKDCMGAFFQINTSTKFLQV
jgi:hypothetical protein